MKNVDEVPFGLDQVNEFVSNLKKQFFFKISTFAFD